ncbi:hypothetical protein DQ04_01471110 [Trypanosoma grayi]|uniref:hypothetical protein n=1 Tax=Trypanosoma grayi TaxID=71804 RepID=UPI0004F476F5|nr:hypothetical protein DQ04_01471110 [Trypanosoma grayi]KEG12725.1 hypothetical protein DQ04_01471110 [Trypanosoma grayi]
MASKGKQLSVLIAGATGNTGSELVSRLVSHPDVARVVALSRYPIPVNRWRTKFPHIHTGDALHCLSVVSVDWNKIVADAAHVPASYVREGRWYSSPETSPSLWDTWNKMRGSASGLRFASPTGINGSDVTAMMKKASEATPPLGRAGKIIGRNDGSFLSSSSSSRSNGDISSSSSSSGCAMGYVKVIGDPSVNDDAQNGFLNALLQNTFYKSVFSGHHVAINCLGSKKFFMGSEVHAVDHQYAIAFAKMVRVFNCMVHAEPLEEEEEILMERHSKQMDSVLWGEIYAACYGRVAPAWFHTNAEAGKTGSRETGASDTSARPPWPEQQLSRGGEATLQQFTQVSVMGSSMWSPLPYFRAHAESDEELLTLFNRNTQDISRNFLHKTELDGEDGDDGETVTQQRAELLLRRDVVKLWDNSHVTIWRPGPLQRGDQRLVERMLGVFVAQIDVRCFAEVIVDDIIASVEDDRGFGEVGSVKVVGGNSVAVRVKMKKLEMELNRRGIHTSATAARPEGTTQNV